MSWYRQQPPPEVVLGGIPLIRASHFRDLGQEYWNGTEFSSWNAPHELERLQRLLYEQTKAKDQNDSEDDDDEENETTSIVLVSKYQPYRYRKWSRNNKIPFHEDILPRWEAFASAQKNREGLELIKIDNIVLPPLPYFSESFVPLLTNNDDTLTSLELSGCNLGSVLCSSQVIS